MCMMYVPPGAPRGGYDREIDAVMALHATAVHMIILDWTGLSMENSQLCWQYQKIGREAYI